MHLSDRQRAALASICDTFAPGDGAGIPSASRLGAVDIMAALVLHNPRAAEVRQFLRLLDLWDSPVIQLVLGGGARRFSRQPQQRREQMLLALAESRHHRQAGAVPGAQGRRHALLLHGARADRPLARCGTPSATPARSAPGPTRPSRR